MTRFHFERPDGNPQNAQNILIHLNEFVPPQGYGGGVTPPAVGDMEHENATLMQHEDFSIMEFEA